MEQGVKGIADEIHIIRGRVLPKVTVIMSTYNGELFLREQLESIFDQVDVDVFCLVRDDGSKDNTVDILREFKKEHKENFEFYEGENIGVVKSFSELVTKALLKDGEWIAFCDQDDVWMKEKLSRAISVLENEKEKDIPLVYCSNLLVVNVNLDSIGMMWKSKPNYNKYTALVQNCSTGCTQVFNRIAANKYCECKKFQEIEMHDYWLFLIGVYLGKVVYDDQAQIYYRQHEKNVVGARRKTIINALKHIADGRSGHREMMVRNFYNTYYAELHESDKEILNNIINYRKNIKKKLRILVDKRYRGYSFSITNNFKLRVFLNALY